MLPLNMNRQTRATMIPRSANTRIPLEWSPMPMESKHSPMHTKTNSKGYPSAWIRKQSNLPFSVR